MSITAVSALNSNAAATTSSSASSSSAGLSSTLNLTFSEYLNILTAQLQNQDPTNATDPNQFTQELVEMGGVQQQITTNQDLTNLVSATSANSLATGVGYVGNVVQADSSSGEFPLQSSYAEFGYNLASTASKALITIQDSNGNVVDTFQGGTASGGNYVSWNGATSSGGTAPDGAYTFTVTATDANGNAITSSDPVALFQVTSVQTNSDGTLQLYAGSLSLDSSDVTNVYSAETAPKATANTTSSSSTSSTSG
jgi:flagellar basal-body rod modification protein FlgD